MIDLIKKIIKPKYQALNEIEILGKNILDNLDYLSSLQKQAEMFPVLKSNAYGHGLKEVCQILNKSNIKMLAVDSFPEAQIVYKNFKGDVLIMGEMPIGAYKYCKKKRTRFGKKIKIHLFLNTGMNREGIDDLESFINNNRKYLEKVEVSGFCSHLAEADNTDSPFNKKQETKFFEGLEILHKNKIYPKWVHLGNSAGVFNLKNKVFTAFRPGIALYGHNPFKEQDKSFVVASNLKPALRLYSTIVSVHKLKTGDRVSYNDNFRLEEDSNIAIIPFGYFEGLDRRFSNCAKFLFNKNSDIFWAKVAGNVCMNLSCINCMNREISIGDKVQIISEINNMENSINNLSNKIEIINYEMLIRLNSNIKRKII
jgi:alanine racemase